MWRQGIPPLVLCCGLRVPSTPIGCPAAFGGDWQAAFSALGKHLQVLHLGPREEEAAHILGPWGGVQAVLMFA